MPYLTKTQRQEWEDLFEQGKKCCIKCGELKSISDFGPHKTGWKGLRSRCKECKRKEHRPIQSPKTIRRKELFQQGLKCCCKCHHVKSLKEFYNYARSKDNHRSVCKKCENLSIYEYRAKNPDKHRKINRDYYYRHYDAIRASHKYIPRPGAVEHRALIAKGLRCCKKCGQIKSIDEFHNQIDGCQGHRSQCKECDKKYISENRDKTKSWRHNYRARKTSNGGSFTAEEWRALCEKYGNKCLCCGSENPLTVDHIIPISKGGTSNIENIQCLCFVCNCRKREKIIDYRPDNLTEQKPQMSP